MALPLSVCVFKERESLHSVAFKQLQKYLLTVIVTCTISVHGNERAYLRTGHAITSFCLYLHMPFTDNSYPNHSQQHSNWSGSHHSMLLCSPWLTDPTTLSGKYHVLIRVTIDTDQIGEWRAATVSHPAVAVVTGDM